jgi:hypothetical protein
MICQGTPRLRAKTTLIFSAAFCLILIVNMTTRSQSQPGYVPPQWQTTAEKTDYKQTSTYDEAIAYSKKIAAASGGLITYTTFGKSGEGAICRC